MNRMQGNMEDMDLVWGAEAIGKVINTPRKRTYRLLAAGLIKSARHVGRHWMANRHALRREFAGMPEEGRQDCPPGIGAAS